MEEVIGSIPIRSTKFLNNLDKTEPRERNAGVWACVSARVPGVSF